MMLTKIILTKIILIKIILTQMILTEMILTKKILTEMIDNEDTDDEMHDLEHNDNEDTEEEMDMDDDNDSKFNLLHIINDTQSIFEYCIKLRKEYRKALKQFNNLNEEDTRSVIKSYAKLEVIVKDDQFGIENDNTNSDKNNEDNDDFWDFVYYHSQYQIDHLLQ